MGVYQEDVVAAPQAQLPRNDVAEGVPLDSWMLLAEARCVRLHLLHVHLKFRRVHLMLAARA